MRIFRVAAAAFGGLALSVTLATTPALAAAGHFIWVGPSGKAYSIQNPPDRRCFTMGEAAKAPRNQTKKSLTVYAGKKCSGKATHLKAGRRAGNNVTFRSVMFGR